MILTKTSKLYLRSKNWNMVLRDYDDRAREGRSTLVNLFSAFMTPKRRRNVIDGVSIKEHIL